MASRDVKNFASWLLLPPGNLAILRFPSDSIPEGARQATPIELLTANLGKPFPWGSLPHTGNASRLWKEYRIGIGGLIHDRWFVTSGGRFGGAPNVPESLPGSLRCCMLLDGGECAAHLEENEGYAVVKEMGEENLHLYRRVQMHAAEHVVADGGAIILSPVNDKREVFVGFVGRCQTCPNPELVSFRQLQVAVPDYHFSLLPEWQKWQV